MELVVDNKLILEPIENILKQVRIETNNSFYKDIQNKGDNLMVTCPCHKDGNERKASCSVLNTSDDPKVPRGWHHCFTCGISMPLEEVIGHCFGQDKQFGIDWLREHYGDVFYQQVVLLPEIELQSVKPFQTFLDESILVNYNYYHEYMWKRKLSKEVVDRFEVGYDPQRQMLTFPVRDEYGRLKMITGRSVLTKMFHIDRDIEKPVYLLYYMLQQHIKTVYVVESQINALYMNSLGYPTIGLIGTGSQEQYRILKKCGIRNYILLFDGDDAGHKGAERFRRNMGQEFMVKEIRLPEEKDVNDLTAEEIKNLIEKSNKL